MSSVDAHDTQGIAGALGKELGLEEVRTGSWFAKVVQLYLRWNGGRSRRMDASLSHSEQARRAIRKACIKTGVTGFASGVTSTGSALLTLNTSGVGALVGLPATVGGLLGDVLYRAVVHVDLTCELGSIYGISFDPEDPADLLRLYGFVFESEDEDRPLDGARGLVERVIALGGDDVGLKIGRKLLGQALRRNVVPVVGIATSTAGNVRTTKRLGETVHRYVRYQRALQEHLEGLLSGGAEVADVAVEGVWFVLTADGEMKPEEAAILAWLLRMRPAIEQGALRRRFVEDEAGWFERLRATPPEHRQRLLSALEVAAAVDRSASLPERRMLRGAARALGLEFDPHRLEELTTKLDYRQ